MTTLRAQRGKGAGAGRASHRRERHAEPGRDLRGRQQRVGRLLNPSCHDHRSRMSQETDIHLEKDERSRTVRAHGPVRFGRARFGDLAVKARIPHADPRNQRRPVRHQRPRPPPNISAAASVAAARPSWPSAAAMLIYPRTPAIPPHCWPAKWQPPPSCTAAATPTCTSHLSRAHAGRGRRRQRRPAQLAEPQPEATLVADYSSWTSSPPTGACTSAGTETILVRPGSHNHESDGEHPPAQANRGV